MYTMYSMYPMTAWLLICVNDMIELFNNLLKLIKTEVLGAEGFLVLKNKYISVYGLIFQLCYWA